MPFAVMFLSTDASPRPAQVEAMMRDVAAAEAGPVGADGVVRPAGQPEFTVNDNGVYFGRLSPLTCKVVFDAALRTNSIIFTAGRGGPYMIMKGARGKLTDELGPSPDPLVVPDEHALCGRLGQALREWDEDIGRARKAGILDENDQPILPPADPGSARRIADDPSGIAASCQGVMTHDLPSGWKVVRTLVTQEPKWGVVWRADVATDDPGDLFRDLCFSRDGTSKGLFIASQPLEMFDPKQSVPPLPEK